MMRGLRWYKSSYSSDQGGACVEVANLDTGPAVRDSKDPTGPVLTCSPAQWVSFTAAISRGTFG
ncbi:MAG: DUF397 domain-containing protein [Pseudonocardiaceae bacterium]